METSVVTPIAERMLPLAVEQTGGEGLAVRALSHRYARRAVVDDVSFALPPGEVHCLMGPSGCGKTTTLRLIAGLERVQSGEIRLDGAPVAAPGSCLPPEQRRIGLMFQDLALFPHLTVAGNVAFGIRSLARAQRDARVLQLLDMVGMRSHAAKFPYQLSGGEQQRIALARALAPRPRLMLLDEAFSALDASLRVEVREHALDLLRETGVPTLLVTHDPDEAIVAGDRVHVMQDGRLVQSGRPDELYRTPVNAFVAGFFGPTLRFSSHVESGRARTPVGSLAVTGLDEAAPVDVVLRPEGLALSFERQGADAHGRVVGCRRMGPACNISLELEDGVVVTLRKPADTPHRIGTTMGLSLDPHFAFVFPRTAAPFRSAA